MKKLFAFILCYLLILSVGCTINPLDSGNDLQTPDEPRITTEPLPSGELRHGDDMMPLVEEMKRNCRSIAEMVEKYPELHYSMSFYEGEGFAYIELMDKIYFPLNVIFEDYRTGKLYLITHNDGYHYLTSFNCHKSDIYNLDNKNNIQKFRDTAFKDILPANLDYAYYLNFDEESIVISEHLLDKKVILDNYTFYAAAYVKRMEEKNEYIDSEDNREHLEVLLDYILKLDFEKRVDIDQDATTEYANIFIYLRPLEDGNCSIYINLQTDGKKYYMMIFDKGRYLTKEQFYYIVDWVKPITDYMQVGNDPPIKK